MDVETSQTTTSGLKKITLITIPVLVVTLFAALVVIILPSDSATVRSQRVHQGEYYLYPLSLELEGRKTDGSSWDSLGGSSPDPFVTIEWKGQVVYKSSTKNDTLLAHWSIAEFSLTKIAVAGGKTSVDDQIKAARVSISTGGSVTVKIWDDDITINDFIGEFEIPFSDLTLGENSFSPNIPGVTRLTIKVVDLRAAPDLLQ